LAELFFAGFFFMLLVPDLPAPDLPLLAFVPFSEF
jgi:hypothetical protein